VTRRGGADAADTVESMLQRFGGIPAGPLAPGVPDQPGPSLEADLQLSLQIGKLATALDNDRAARAAQRRERSAAIFPFDFNPQLVPLTAGAGVLNLPSIYSPNPGYVWDIRKLTAASFTTGTVTVYKNAQNDANTEVVFTSAGTYWFGSGQEIINSNDFLLFAASGITGNVTISGRAVQIREDYLADYLL
jgi:hypothetical protein